MSTPNVPTIVRYTGDGVATEFTIPFPYQRKEYVKVYISREGETEDTLLSESQYEFVGDESIRFPVRDSDDILREGDILAIQRETTLGSPYVFDNQRRLFPEDVMDADDLSFQQIQELKDAVDRALKVPVASHYIPEEMWEEFNEGVAATADAALRAKKSEEKAEAAANDPNVVTIGEDLRSEPSQIKTANEHFEEINTVAENIRDVQNVAGSLGQIRTVANDIDNVKAVAGNKDNIDAVAAINAQVSKVADISEQVVAVYDNKDNIDAVAKDLVNIDAVGQNIKKVNTVADNITQVGIVSQNIDDVVSTGRYINDVRNVSNSIYDVNKVADNIEDVVNVSNHLEDIAQVAQDIKKIEEIKEFADDIGTVAENIDDVKKVAENADSLKDVIENMDDIKAAKERAESASDSAEEARKWAVGTQYERPEGSSKYWAERAKASTESAFHYKGTKPSADELPQDGNEIGDVWNVDDTGANYAWTGSEWDKLSETIDLSNYYTKEEVNNAIKSVDVTEQLKDYAKSSELESLEARVYTVEDTLDDLPQSFLGWKGAWDRSVQYNAGDIVNTNNGNELETFWLALKENANTYPSLSASAWKQISNPRAVNVNAVSENWNPLIMMTSVGWTDKETGGMSSSGARAVGLSVASNPMVDAATGQLKVPAGIVGHYSSAEIDAFKYVPKSTADATYLSIADSKVFATNTELEKRALPDCWAPSDDGVDLTLGVSGTKYVAPDDGYFNIVKATSGTTNQYVQYILYGTDSKTHMTKLERASGGSSIYMTIPVAKDTPVYIYYDAGGDTSVFRFYKSKGAR